MKQEKSKHFHFPPSTAREQKNQNRKRRKKTFEKLGCCSLISFLKICLFYAVIIVILQQVRVSNHQQHNNRQNIT
jgi:hypothetical protein